MHIVDAAKAAGVKRVVLISSILTDGRAMGAADSPGFKITNAFGGVLDEKLVTYCDFQFLAGRGPDHGQKVLSAIMFFFPQSTRIDFESSLNRPPRSIAFTSEHALT